jgi:hypothetical protein
MAECKTKATPRRTKESTMVERSAKTNTAYVMGMINSLALGKVKDHRSERLTIAADLPPDSNAAK